MAITIVTPANGADPIGSQIVAAFSDATTTASDAVGTAISNAAANPGDPTNMIAMQVAMANYNIALSVQSSVIKSIEETAKSITQKL